jgi:hypothetical protein
LGEVNCVRSKLGVINSSTSSILEPRLLIRILFVPVNPLDELIAQAGPPELITVHAEPLSVRLSKLSAKTFPVISGELDSTRMKDVFVMSSLPALFDTVRVTG